ncbi:MAG: tripartite tricarboxylate transporter substrate-binding protein [Betaproteobacteria bacterium]
MRIAAAVLATAVCVAPAQAQGYPSKPVRFVTSEPGGGNDIVARVLAEGLTASLGQRVIVDNRGIVAAEIAKNASPDGYTLLVYGANIWLLPYLRERVAWDPLRDFAPITIAVQLPNVLVVHPTVPVKTTREFIDYARTRPGKLDYAAGTIGVSPHLAAELFKSMTALDLVRVPYKGGGPALNGLIAGETQVMFPNVGSVMTHMKSGRVRALGVSSAQPSALAPGLPTIASVVPGYEFVAVICLYAPAKTPRAIVEQLNREAARVLKAPDVKERLFNAGNEVVANSAAEFAAYMKVDMQKMGKVIKDAGIRAE